MRCAFFDWRDEVQKKSKKQDIELAALLFLVGLLLFIYPVVNQVSSYHTDEEEYEDLAMQFIQPEASPAPILPIPEKTEEPTAKKLDDARKEGQVAKSQEIATAFSLLALFLILR